MGAEALLDPDPDLDDDDDEREQAIDEDFNRLARRIANPLMLPRFSLKSFFFLSCAVLGDADGEEAVPAAVEDGLPLRDAEEEQDEIRRGESTTLRLIPLLETAAVERRMFIML